MSLMMEREVVREEERELMGRRGRRDVNLKTSSHVVGSKGVKSWHKLPSIIPKMQKPIKYKRKPAPPKTRTDKSRSRPSTAEQSKRQTSQPSTSRETAKNPTQQPLAQKTARNQTRPSTRPTYPEAQPPNADLPFHEINSRFGVAKSYGEEGDDRDPLLEFATFVKRMPHEPMFDPLTGIQLRRRFGGAYPAAQVGRIPEYLKGKLPERDPFEMLDEEEDEVNERGVMEPIYNPSDSLRERDAAENELQVYDGLNMTQWVEEGQRRRSSDEKRTKNHFANEQNNQRDWVMAQQVLPERIPRPSERDNQLHEILWLKSNYKSIQRLHKARKQQLARMKVEFEKEAQSIGNLEKLVALMKAQIDHLAESFNLNEANMPLSPSRTPEDYEDSAEKLNKTYTIINSEY